jgi:hypothetical protein
MSPITELVVTDFVQVTCGALLLVAAWGFFSGLSR